MPGLCYCTFFVILYSLNDFIKHNLVAKTFFALPHLLGRSTVARKQCQRSIYFVKLRLSKLKEQNRILRNLSCFNRIVITVEGKNEL